MAEGHFVLRKALSFPRDKETAYPPFENSLRSFSKAFGFPHSSSFPFFLSPEGKERINKII
jgi:hypothetical protein